MPKRLPKPIFAPTNRQHIKAGLTNPSLESDYRDSHQSLSKPSEYDPQFFDESTTLGLFWQIEREILESILSDGTTRHRALDFACGTGRILGWLIDRADEAVGIDVSGSMLAVARSRAPSATIIHGDLTVTPTLVKGPFDLITAFRFFLNAQPELRRDVLRALREVMDPDGILIANFHLNPSSLTGLYLRAMRRFRRIQAPQSMIGLSDALRLFSRNGFEPIAAHGYGYLLHRKTRPTLRGISAPLERFLARLNPMPSAAMNFIVVARPTKKHG